MDMGLHRVFCDVLARAERVDDHTDESCFFQSQALGVLAALCRRKQHRVVVVFLGAAGALVVGQVERGQTVPGRGHGGGAGPWFCLQCGDVGQDASASAQDWLHACALH